MSDYYIRKLKYKTKNGIKECIVKAKKQPNKGVLTRYTDDELRQIEADAFEILDKKMIAGKMLHQMLIEKHPKLKLHRVFKMLSKYRRVRLNQQYRSLTIHGDNP